MTGLKKNCVALMILASVFMTGCDAGNILEIVQKVAEGIQQAIPAVKEVIDTISQAVNPTGNNAGTNNTNTSRNNPPVERNEPNAQAGVNIPSAGDQEVVGEGGQSPSVTTDIPGQTGAQETGSSFMTRTQGMSRVQKDQAIVEAITAGNIPDFLRNFKDVTVQRRLSDGNVHSITYKVMPDYLAIGTDNDFVRAPMTPIAAQRIADHFGCVLPTTQMVDDIYQNAQTKLAPRPMSGGNYPNWESRMTRNEFFVEHQRLIEDQADSNGHSDGDLVAGHKKDVVISNSLNRNSGKVAIYGWHRTNGRPIQNLTTVHSADYVDYSHGIRLIQKTVMVDGREMNIEDVLRDPVLSELLSNEGPISNTSAVR